MIVCIVCNGTGLVRLVRAGRQPGQLYGTHAIAHVPCGCCAGSGMSSDDIQRLGIARPIVPVKRTMTGGDR